MARPRLRVPKVSVEVRLEVPLLRRLRRAAAESGEENAQAIIVRLVRREVARMARRSAS